MRQIIHIQATSSHIGSYEQLGEVLTEFLHGEVTLLLTQIAVQTLCIIAVTNQLISNLLRLNLRPTEDDGKDTRIEIHDAFQG